MSGVIETLENILWGSEECSVGFYDQTGRRRRIQLTQQPRRGRYYPWPVVQEEPEDEELPDADFASEEAEVEEFDEDDL